MSLPRISEAISMLENGNAREALPVLEELSTQYPLYVIPRILRARAYETTGDTEQALAAWREARFLSPANAQIREGVQRASRLLLALKEDVLDPSDVELDLTSAGDLESVGSDHHVSTTGESEPQQSHSAIEGSESLESDQIDKLIAELENGRIDPKGNIEGYPDPLDNNQDADLISETLARIYAKQERYHEAARVYLLLAAQNPEKSEEYLAKASELDNIDQNTSDQGTTASET